ncbi:MAG: filamentous hemagglutinin family protein [Verrucomicrobiota bacterium]
MPHPLHKHFASLEELNTLTGRMPVLLPAARERSTGILPVSIFGTWLAAGTLSYGGDILRQGAGADVRQTDASAGTAVAAQQQARASQRDALAKTAQSLEAVRVFQAQARALAAKNGAGQLRVDPNHAGLRLPLVPNGLGAGGLQLSGTPAGALAPVQSQVGGLTNVTIRQTEQQAFLNWETFNVGRETSLNFDQSAGGSNASQWIAFNRVHDPSGRPSLILGRISAQGQVYVINQNGIIFGGTSQVNTGSLVASSLPINDNLIARGLLNNPDSQFLFSALPIPAGAKGTPAFAPPVPNLPDNFHGDVTVEPGALISSPVSADGNGGRILLAGPNVTNGGSLVAPNGQVILAAGLQIGVDAHKSSDASLRGLDVYVGSVGSYGGTAVNNGLIEVPRGSASMSGRVVTQNAAIESSATVSLNGRIDLLADYDAVPNTGYDPALPSTGTPYLFKSTGAVTLGAGSVTRILPEMASAEKTIGTELPLRSRINLQGQTVLLGSNARVLAPNALVSVRAGTWAFNSSITPATSVFLASGGQVYFDQGSSIDVSGSTGVTAPISQVILSLVLRGGELAPSPLQRNGALRGPTLTVDLRNRGVYNGREWVGTPLADLTGYEGLIERTVGELTVAGGSVDIAAGGSVVMQRGSSINVSGGSIEYLGGMVKTSRVWSDGHLVDIKDATPDRVYGGVFSGTSDEVHPRWGVTRTFTLPLAPTGAHFEPTYLHGGDAGSLAISAPGMALDGQLTALVSPGPRQLRSSSSSSMMPAEGDLTLSFSAQEVLNNAVITSYPSSPDIIFGNTRQGAAGSFGLDLNGLPGALDEDRRRTVYLSPELTAERGWGSITLHNEGGSITVPDKIRLEAPAGGAFSFVASNIRILGDVKAPGGTLEFQALNLTPYDAAVIRNLREADRRLPSSNAGRGVFTLGGGVSLSTAGLLVDDRLNAADFLTQPAVIAGGSVSVKAYSAHLADGSVVDVSGGAMMSAQGALTYGNGGGITIQAGQDPQLNGLTGGHLKLGASLLGYSGAKGGTLAVQAPLVQVGGRAVNPDILLLGADFFSQGGFGSFSLTGLGMKNAAGETLPAVSITAGTWLEPVSHSLVAVAHASEGGGLTLVPVNKPVGERTPVSLSFLAPGVRDGILDAPLIRGDIVTGAGSVISTDPLASVTLSGKTVSVLGSISTPGGSIALTAGRSADVFPGTPEALTTLFVGSRGVLSTAGTTLLREDAFGRRIGSMLPGGEISLSGNILAQAGAVLDVSGARGRLDLSPAVARPLESDGVPPASGLTAPLYSLATERAPVDSPGGTISLRGGEFLFSDATLLGKAGGPTALGGTLTVGSGRFYPPGTTVIPATDVNLTVRQSGPAIPAGAVSGSGGMIGKPVTGAEARGYFAADSFNRGGFDSLSLNGVVGFQEAVNLKARSSLRVADGGVLFADNVVRLTAPYVALGRAFETPGRTEDRRSPFGSSFAPTYGSGRLIVTAENIDLGTLSLRNVGSATLTASNGDIRGSGIFNIAGDLTLRAAQVYPVTASPFEIFAYDHNSGGRTVTGSVTIQASDTRQLPLSAGGSLGIYASRIVQDGVLRAPFGGITLGWDGTGTAPVNLLAGTAVAAPVTRQLTLGGGSVTSVSAVDPLTGKGILIPYGVSTDGLTWIDPRGVDITAGGLPVKSVSIAGQNLDMAAGATIDLRGGGDLFAYRWSEGNIGPEDILASSGSYAVLPGYDSAGSPFAPYNSSDAETNLIRESGPGYVNDGLKFGDRVYLQASQTLRAGYYTLLPARYALLPGGVLVTPQAGAATGTAELADGASLVSGYQFNSLNEARAVPTLAAQFELASGAVIRQRAEYETYLAGSFLKEAAARLNLPTPLLTQDSGRLVLQATQSMNLLGNVLSPSISGGRGSSIDISSGLDFVINRAGTSAGAGKIALGSETLRRWGADSLVIGGKRSTNDAGQTVLTATSGNITVDNAGAALSAADLTLAATGSITLAPGSQLSSTGSAKAEDYYLTGNGVLVRVSGDAEAQVIRTGVTPAASNAALIVGAGAQLSGAGITLDSTNATTIDSGAALSAQSYAVNSGRISLVLDNPGALAADAGLILTGDTLSRFSGGDALSLRSYSTLDLYGSGVFGGGLKRLALNAGEIRAVNAPASGNSVIFAANEIRLGNAAGAASVVRTASGSAPGGAVAFNAGVIRLTGGDLAFNNIGSVSLNAARGLTGEGTGRVGTQADLSVSTPLLTGAAGSNRSLTAGGVLTVSGADSGTASVTPGLGATLALSGRETTVDSAVLLPGGSLSLTSTGGALRVNGRLDVSGQAWNFYDVTRYTDAGTISLNAASGDVVLGPGSLLNLSAQSGGGNAGTLNVSVPQGTLLSGGKLSAVGGNGGMHGSFTLDTLSLPTTAELSGRLTAAGFTLSQSIRVRSGDVEVDGDVVTEGGVVVNRAAVARSFELTADQGNITVSGLVDSSGATGGSIHLAANGNLTLLNGSRLTVAGADFDSAGKGGQITLEAGTQRNGVAGTGMLDPQSGSTLDLSVAAKTAASASLGQFSGKLHLRAPRNAAGTDILSTAIGSAVIDASSIVMEGYKVYDLTGSGGAIATAVQSQIKNDGTAFLGAAGTTSSNYTAMMSRLLANNAGLSSAFVLAPGAEIINTTGNLTLGTASTTTLDDWDLSTFRFGEKSAAGVLTLRAAGNLVFNNTLSDGFTPYAPATNPPAANLALWQGRLTARNPLLPVNAQSFSYRLTAGADLNASGFAAAVNAASPATAGSIILGKAGTSTQEQANTVAGEDGALIRTVIPQRWQVIRTGSGDITLSAAGNIQLLNQLATIYSAGTAVADPTLGGSFDVPRPGAPPAGTGGLGATQNSPLYPAQYSMGGGNVVLSAGGNIEHLTRNATGELVADSQLQMPSNWLYRRGTVDPLTGKFAEGRIANDVLSTSWWVDFNNFFQGIGALGGGNVSLLAAGNISNVDAVAPTNMRVTKGSETNPLAANQTAVELGGGDVVVKAGGNIDAGVYYVERGTGTLRAGGSILTNATRSVLSPSSITAGQGSAYTQLPTTLFAGRAGFDVSARGDLLLGPVASPFLLPEGLGNSVWYKSWFSTYSQRSAVNVSSLGGAITLRTEATPYLQSAGASDPLLYLWAANKLLLGNDTASRAKPWLRLNESGIDEIIRYKTITSLLPGSLTVSAYSGDINLAGRLTLSPSATGTLSLLASGAINALQPNGIVNMSGLRTAWGTSTVNVSDASPLAVPGVLNPLGYTTAQVQAVSTRLPLFFAGVDALFAETGSVTGVLQTKQALHAAGLLHLNDPEPLRLYAGAGDISGLTLFSPKAARIFAGRDLSDTSLYIQNVREADVSIVTSGRDIIPANAAAALRSTANRPGNTPNLDAGPLAGDIQISGPGTLQVLAGRTLDLGTVAGSADGTGVGLTSIGNARNPALGFEGSVIIAGAGLGSAAGLSGAALDFDSFIKEYVKGGQGPQYLAGLTTEMSGRSFDQLSAEDQKRIALEVFYRVLRDAGRSNGGTIPGNGYADGFAAIGTLFTNPGAGDILTRGRDIRTRNGGSISLLAPGGGLQLANTAIGNPLAPPGIVTESGGNISIFTRDDVGVGIGRIFTLRGGNQIIWSSEGDIAAGSSSKTVKSAPPTRVLIDPQSGAVQTDLAGLATGGGIGVLATVAGVAPGDVDLIAPTGVVDAGDAGIRSSGNLTIAATQVLNAGNIAVSGSSSGTPTTAVSTPNVGGLSAASNTAAAGNAAATAAAQAAAKPEAAPVQALPSIYTVEVLGYGGGEGSDEEQDDEERRRRAAEAEAEKGF